MDYDGFERRPPRAPNSLSREDQRHIGATRQHEKREREEREKKALSFLECSRNFENMLSVRGIEDEQAKALIAMAAAKEIADRYNRPNIEVKELGRLIEDAIAKGLAEQERLRSEEQARAQEEARTEATREADQRVQTRDPDRPAPEIVQAGHPLNDVVRSRTQLWPGKYQELKELSPDPGDDQVARQQREESDRRHSTELERTSFARELSEQDAAHEERLMRTEQTDRKQEQSESKRELNDRAQRREAIARQFGREIEEAERGGELER